MLMTYILLVHGSESSEITKLCNCGLKINFINIKEVLLLIMSYTHWLSPDTVVRMTLNDEFVFQKHCFSL